MHEYNADNERIKRRYFTYLREAQRYSEQSVDAVAKALSRFEAYTGFRSFKAFHTQQAVSFKRFLAEQRGQRTGQPLSKSTLHSTLTALRNFFHWLAGQPGYKSLFTYSDAEYFNLPEKDVRTARVTNDAPAPTIEQIQAALRQMPAGSVLERRDRALFAFTLLTGARDGALASLRMKHVDFAGRRLIQDAREVRTKNSKTFTVSFFPVPEEFEQIARAWAAELREQLLWGKDDPLFPATKVIRGDDARFEAVGIARTPWSTAEPIRQVFREAFARAGLPYFNPHSLRKTLALLGERLCQSPEEMKAWSQNLGHEKIQTTFSSYGRVPLVRQSEILLSLGERPASNGRLQSLIGQLVREAQNHGKG